ncbi:MAG: cobalamin B12-binding domain-containing protein [Proteobacteria bacterium]|nr:cobalamin B12-binding domain-containing protein [Pseudomonadota bacterium]NDC23663.1 cobalamin B12-binding domain-containing protein [Pseudomonadota bacterium]NDD03727.1 cobalamin B12-binding domain-containing protein [Pseudomonadota bacterium]NDG26209.1 cobalamin B12-binding domain-containing protein [Pseudomonadota bacterium]
METGGNRTLMIRVLVAKPGLDGHDRGAKVLAHALRDAGMEVIYTGLHQTPQMIVNTAIQEDVQVICVSILSGAHQRVFPEILTLLKDRKAQDIHVLGGGVIPDSDVVALKKIGVREVFTAANSLSEIVAFIKKLPLPQ